MKITKKISGYLIIFIGILFAPFLPFPFLFIFPLFALILNTTIVALCFSLLIDAFLLPAFIPITNTLTGWTLVALLAVALLKNSVKL